VDGHILALRMHHTGKPTAAVRTQDVQTRTPTSSKIVSVEHGGTALGTRYLTVQSAHDF
jgi:hypothetical protein